VEKLKIKDRTYPQIVKEAKKKYLKEYGDFSKSSIEDIVTQTASLKRTVDEHTKKLEAFKDFFRAIGTSGEHFEGNPGAVNLIGRTTSTVDPIDLRNLLGALGRTAEFMGMISVKVADSRKKLGTVLFDKIAKVSPNSSITVKITQK
jgi:hypothetical protein